MAADPCAADVLLISVVWNATQLGIATGIAYEVTVQDVVIRGEGKTGPSCPGTVVTDLVAVADFLVKPPIDPIANKNTSASLVATCGQAGGGTTVHTATGMIPRGCSFNFDRDNPPGKWRQTFRHKGDMDAMPLS